ncbi:MAG: SAM-dependent methyltransferase [Gammaproteobacteria bacterium CG11_big_fil_rev_8_21_14_0_20_46_22]|nr:MAG: SAM-dependent methyltransferase [Gammaproteobacteria bacterium CG12_big_fil_rev_8_21_14_0_65_46_12]PIR11498.1 MAG: SAM-dependent methyltransferase [Gammaproteobacteria bacterium CG11_big_fil_rev_8_21_14_0_20_46_22]
MKASDLPQPSPEALAHSAQLRAQIAENIKRHGGAISFHDYMQLCLYAQGLGYYSAGSTKFGPSGDFITAPELTPLFGECLAKPCADVLLALENSGDILELGAGSGKLARDILCALEKINCLPNHYYILEVSPDLRERQARMLKDTCPDFFDRIVWLDTLPETFSGIMLANEVIDAMPVDKIRSHNGQWHEVLISSDGGQFIERLGQPVHDIPEALNALSQTHASYSTEINRLQAPWIKTLAESMTRGVCLIIDYGYPAHEYYHPQRTGGTLTCHYRHHAHHDVFLHPGLQDITAHVDFTALAEAGIAAGFELTGFTNQASFLVNCGLMDKLRQGESIDLKTQNVYRQLTHPNAMGELFKAIAFSKGLDSDELTGFQDFDQRHRL